MKKGIKKLLLSLYHYFCFFILMAFVITCCMLLFLNTMTKSMGPVLTEESINTAAVLTFWNVVFLSLACTVIDAIRRRITVERPVSQIVGAAERISEGDYSVRIPPMKSLNRADGLDRISECFNKMAEELSGVETLRSDFISNVSHELKTPLAVIKSNAALLGEDISPDEKQKSRESIESSAARLSELISNILKLSKLENQQIFPSPVRHDLGSSVAEVLLSFEEVWEKKGIDIIPELDEGVIINQDPELLSVVWSNLISNALKFTESGGKVYLTLKKDGRYASLTVRDTGCGIKSDTGKHIFEKFYQGDTSHKTEGNGLGLALVKRIVDITEGELSVESKEGVGSTFTVRILRCEDE